MSKTFLHSVSSANSKFPKDLLIWNYWDHEHIVGTHFKHYKKVNILFEDDGLLVLNKPCGLAVHGGSGLSLGAIEAMRLERPQDKFLELVHRLDRETSGCLIFAKKRTVLLELQSAMQKNKNALTA